MEESYQPGHKEGKQHARFPSAQSTTSKRRNQDQDLFLHGTVKHRLYTAALSGVHINKIRSTKLKLFNIEQHVFVTRRYRNTSSVQPSRMGDTGNEKKQAAINCTLQDNS